MSNAGRRLAIDEVALRSKESLLSRSLLSR